VRGFATTLSQAFYEEYWSGEAPPDTDPYTAPRVRRFLELVPAHARVLDAGCGAGGALQLLALGNLALTGIDVSARAIERARQLCPQADLRVASFDAELPFPDATFDAVYSGDVIEHVYDVRRMAKELHRVLRPDGLLFLSTPYHGFLKNLVLVTTAFDRHFDPEGPHIRFFSDGALRRLLERQGFSVERVEHLGRTWPLWANSVAIAHRR